MPWDEDAYLRRVRAACFVCEALAGNPDYRHHELHRDDDAVVFLSRWPWLRGHTLVAPVRHRERVVGDFTTEEYLRLQRVLHATGAALENTLTVERLYVLSLGSQQGNCHVHWHVAPLPPGVPYAEQQLAALDGDRGWLDVPADEQAELAGRLRDALARLLDT
ncbi:Diadenosine tetraphosphate (Ap4A) hydrolase [Micromonospora siamensis]|uniref:Diadenosine tetraphosphate (Ap4A) hydrolase n=1 Tax=Micromonospora siamensis TaxID=299152 RepID=A0A1C5JUB0_9ACTN|nr:Diadenosine tetraphosphate (Ap4A) hydrolase [Micromonospora siamensis]